MAAQMIEGRFIMTHHFIYEFYSRMMVLVQSSFHTTWTSLFEMNLELNLLDWKVNELECELGLEDMKHTWMLSFRLSFCWTSKFWSKNYNLEKKI